MSNVMADVLVHISNTLDKVKRSEYLENLNALNGIVSIQSSEQRPHLFVVKYDSGMIAASDILKTTRGSGWDARIIGL